MTKMRISFLVLLNMIFLNLNAQPENSWTKKSPFGGLKRERAVAFSIGDYGYVGCGVDTAEITHNDLWEYNPELDVWTQKASMPALARRNAIGFAIEGKGYVGTGVDLDDGDLAQKLKDFWEYDPMGNSWTAKADYPGGGDTGIYQASAFAELGCGYVVGGKIGPDAYIFELWQYNPETDTWTEKTPFPGGDRYQLISFALEGDAFVGLGTDHDVFRKDLYIYHTATNTWEPTDDFPGTERAAASTFTIGTKGYVVFGIDGGLKDELWEYNYYTESWTLRAAFPGGGRAHGIAFSIGPYGYAGLGKEVTGKKQTFYQYAPVGTLSLLEDGEQIMNVYPNPIRENATVALPEKLSEGSYMIHNLQGQEVQKGSFQSNVFQLNRENLVTGYYHLVIVNSNKVPVGIKKIAII